MFFYPKSMINDQPEEDEEENKDMDDDQDDLRNAVGGKSILDKKDGDNKTIEIIKSKSFLYHQRLSELCFWPSFSPFP